MSCCGKKREHIARAIASVTPPVRLEPAGQDVVLRYAGGSSILVRGPRSGKTYFFAADKPEQTVAGGDADSLLRTGLFRLTN